MLRVRLSAEGEVYRGWWWTRKVIQSVVECPANTLEAALETMEYKRRRAEMKHAVRNACLRPAKSGTPWAQWIRVEALERGGNTNG